MKNTFYFINVGDGSITVFNRRVEIKLTTMTISINAFSIGQAGSRDPLKIKTQKILVSVSIPFIVKFIPKDAIDDAL